MIHMQAINVSGRPAHYRVMCRELTRQADKLENMADRGHQ